MIRLDAARKTTTPLVQLLAVFALAFAFLTAIAASAYATQAPRHFVERVVDRTIGVLSNKTLSKQDRYQQLSAIMHDNFDLAQIGKLALGPYYRTASKAERDEYLAIFGEFLVATYADRIEQAFNDSQSDGFDFSTGDVRATKKDQIVSSAVVSGTSQAAIDWRLRNTDNRFWIVDVAVEGVSMVITQRNEFSAILSRDRDGLAALNRHLWQKIEANKYVVVAAD